MIEKCKLWDMIPEEELKLKLSYGMSELEFDFLGFEHVYLPIAEMVPKNFTIVDLGCYQAAQAYAFENHARYFGVDYYDRLISRSFIPPLRFLPNNASHYVMSIEEFMEKYLNTFDLDETYFIMSYVSESHDKSDWLLSQVKHGTFAYCDTIKTQGIFAEEIKRKIESDPI